MTHLAVFRSALLALLALMTALLFAPASHAAEGAPSGLPPGWHLEGHDLVWSSEAPLRMGGARYEFRSGTRLLGHPTASGRTLRLRLSPSAPLTELSVWASGRRLDVGAATLPIPRTVPPAEPPAAVTAHDTAAPGPYSTERLRYVLPDLPIAGFEAPVEVVGEVIAPVDPAGPMPLVLFLHGRHNTCYRGSPDGESTTDWPCPAGWRSVPSHSGYRYITRVLASQGYLTVSIAANGVNGQDGLFLDGGAFARSELLRHHLAQWAKWSRHGGDPWGGRFHGRANLDQVVLVGHSRGGEGVERAALDSLAHDPRTIPWTIRGLVLIGPTAFGRQVAPGIPTTVILPFCDGHVADLQGQQYVDIARDLTRDRALKSSVMAMGTNHNYYNTEWTPGLSKSPAWDDWFDPGDPQCGEDGVNRLTPAEQQTVGLAYTTALVDLAIAGDARSLPLLDGTRVKPASIGRAQAFVHAVGGDKRVVYAAGKGMGFTASGLSAGECRGFFTAGPFDLRTGCARSLSFELLPHWTPMAFAETAPAPRALKVQWSAAGGHLRIPVNPGDRPFEALDFRIAGVPNAAPVELDVRVRDGSGRWTRLGTRPLKLRSYFGPSPLGKVVARQLRASLAGTPVDPRGITAVELTPRTPHGRFWLLDVSTWRDRVAASDPIRLPRVSVVDVIVKEGDSGDHSLDVPVFVDGAVIRRAHLWVQLTDYASFDQPTRGFPLVLEPGATSASIPFRYVADDVYTPFPQFIQIALLAMRNAVTGDFDASILIEEDDPAPTLSVNAAHVAAEEGAALTWTFHLSEPLMHGGFWSLQFLPAGSRLPELDTDDVPASFLEAYGIVPPDPAVPLSELGIFLNLEFMPGQTQATATVPIAVDGVAEPAEGVVLLLEGFDDPVVPVPIELTGSVTEH